MAKQEINGLLAVEKMKEMAQESKTLMGAVKSFLTILREDVKDSSALSLIKEYASACMGDATTQSIRKYMLSVCQQYAPKQLADGTICTSFTKSHTDGTEGGRIVRDLFKGYKTKSTFGVRFVAECWNRFLKGTPAVLVDNKYMTDDEIIVKYVETCQEMGLEVSENTMLTYMSIKDAQTELAEAV